MSPNGCCATMPSSRETTERNSPNISPLVGRAPSPPRCIHIARTKLSPRRNNTNMNLLLPIMPTYLPPHGRSTAAWKTLLHCRTTLLAIATRLQDLDLHDPSPSSFLLMSSPPSHPPRLLEENDHQWVVKEEPSVNAKATAKAETEPPAEVEEAERHEVGVEGSKYEENSNTFPNHRENIVLEIKTSMGALKKNKKNQHSQAKCPNEAWMGAAVRKIRRMCRGTVMNGALAKSVSLCQH
ncbi:hypothetical protein KI387_029069, partial [Taxus chinensis]